MNMIMNYEQLLVSQDPGVICFKLQIVAHLMSYQVQVL
jgi:hypothetical protein